MTMPSMNAEADHRGAEAAPYLFDDWFDPIEAGLRERVRGFIETMLESELDAVLARPRYGRRPVERNGENPSPFPGNHRQEIDQAKTAPRKHGCRSTDKMTCRLTGATAIARPARAPAPTAPQD